MTRPSAHDDAPKRPGLFDRLFGYDFFISYAHRDGRAYPAALAQALTARGYRVFLDSEEYVAGDDLSVETVRSVGKSRSLIVVAGPEVHSSSWVAREVALFLDRGRVPIVLAHATTPEAQVVDGTLIKPDWLRITEEAPGAVPSDPVLRALDRSFTHLRQRVLRKAALLAVMTAALGLAGLAGFFMRTSAQERDLKLAQLADRLAVRSEQALDDLAYEDAALLALAATAVLPDQPLSTVQRRTLAEAASVYFSNPVWQGAETGGATLHWVAFSGRDDLAAISDGDDGIAIHDLAAHHQVTVLRNPTGRVTALESAPDGSTLVTGDADGVLTVWSWDSTTPLRHLPIHESGPEDYANVNGLAFSLDGAWLASIGKDRGLRLTHTAEDTRVHLAEVIPRITRDGRPNAVTDMEFLPGRSHLVVASEDNDFRVIEVPSGRLLHHYDSLPPPEWHGNGWHDHVMSLDIRADGQELATGSVNGLLQRWSTAEDAQTHPSVDFTEVRVNMTRLSHVQYLVGADQIVTAYDSGDVLIRDAGDGRGLVRLAGSTWPINDMKLSPSGRYLAVAYLGGWTWFYDLQVLAAADLPAQLCRNFDQRGIDLTRITELVGEVDLSIDLAAVICSPQHRARQIVPLLPKVP